MANGKMVRMSMSLVKYAGEFWVTLADFTKTRDAQGYSDLSSVKSAVRTFVVKSSPDKYIAFRGEKQLKNIIHSNRNNPMFDEGDFRGTRTALIHFDMLTALDERFKVEANQKTNYNKFIATATDYIKQEVDKATELRESPGVATGDYSEANSSLVRHLRAEIARVDKEVEIKLRNRAKMMDALNAIESLELEEVM